MSVVWSNIIFIPVFILCVYSFLPQFSSCFQENVSVCRGNPGKCKVCQGATTNDNQWERVSVFFFLHFV